MQRNNRVPAAQYLRMSTEHQQYSLDNQAAAIREYANLNNFLVTHTYRDAGKSGLIFKERQGLRTLLNDVIHGDPPFKAILVYDVSRWGRFQDSDEGAHYEFLCQNDGVDQYYLFPSISTCARLKFGKHGKSLLRGKRLRRVEEFYDSVLAGDRTLVESSSAKPRPFRQSI